MRTVEGGRALATARSVPARLAGALLVLTALAVTLPASPARADYVRDYEWHLAALNMADAWAVTEGAGITVAVLETGMVDGAHPDLEGSVVTGKDFTGGGGAVSDHATGMAGTIAAHGRGGDGIIGIAPAATILSVGTKDTATMAEGFRWATDNGADVINCSCSLGLADAPEVRAAIAYALEHDVVVVAGAGNSSGGPVEVPGNTPGVIGVTGLLKTMDALTPISSYGPEVDLAAPAEELPGPQAGGGYGIGDGGTSAASAVVSGVAALVRAAHPDLDAANVVNRIIATAADVGTAGVDEKFGYGAVNPVAALSADVPLVTDNPLGTPDGGNVPPAATDAATDPPAPTPPAAEAPTASSEPASTDPGCETASAEPAAPPAAAGAAEPPAAEGAAAPPAEAAEPAGAAGPDCAADKSDESSAAGASTDSTAVGPLVAGGAAALLVLALGAWMVIRRRSKRPSEPDALDPASAGPRPPPALPAS